MMCMAGLEELQSEVVVDGEDDGLVSRTFRSRAKASRALTSSSATARSLFSSLSYTIRLRAHASI